MFRVTIAQAVVLNFTQLGTMLPVGFAYAPFKIQIVIVLSDRSAWVARYGECLEPETQL